MQNFHTQPTTPVLDAPPVSYPDLMAVACTLYLGSVLSFCTLTWLFQTADSRSGSLVARAYPGSLRCTGGTQPGQGTLTLQSHTHTSLCPLSSICSSSSSDTIPAFAVKDKARFRVQSDYHTLWARHNNSLIFSCLRIRSTFFSRYSDCMELHLLMSSTNCWDRTPC